MALAEKQKSTVPLMVAHRLIGVSRLLTGDIAEGRAHLDRAIVLFDPLEHRPLATRFGHDVRVSILSFRSLALWLLGYPDSAQAGADRGIREAHEIGHAATLMFGLFWPTLTHIHCGKYAATIAQADELIKLAGEKGAPLWKAGGMVLQGCASALAGETSNAVLFLASSLPGFRSTGTTVLTPFVLSNLGMAYAGLEQFEDAWRSIDEAMTTVEATGERWFEAEIHRTAGEIALLSPERDTAKAQTYFERALEIARTQQARSWELRAATSLARFWRDQGKRAEAHALLAPVYGWFTEGLDTLDLKEARALLAELAS